MVVFTEFVCISQCCIRKKQTILPVSKLQYAGDNVITFSVKSCPWEQLYVNAWSWNVSCRCYGSVRRSRSPQYSICLLQAWDPDILGDVLLKRKDTLTPRVYITHHREPFMCWCFIRAAVTSMIHFRMRYEAVMLLSPNLVLTVNRCVCEGSWNHVDSVTLFCKIYGCFEKGNVRIHMLVRIKSNDILIMWIYCIFGSLFCSYLTFHKWFINTYVVQIWMVNYDVAVI